MRHLCHLASLLLLCSVVSNASGSETNRSFTHTDSLSSELDPHRPLVSNGTDLRPATSNTSAFTVSGTVRDPFGSPAYAIIVVYDNSTKIVSARTWTNASGGYTLEVPSGTYDFYIRKFGPPPIVVRGITISGPTSRDFVVDGVTVADQLISSRPDRAVTFADGIDTTAVAVTASADLGDSITVFNEFATFTIDGAHLGEIVLYDDATHGDVSANDLTYTRSGLGILPNALYTCTIGGAPLLYALTPVGMMRMPSTYLIGVEPTYRAPVEMTGNTQYTARAANVVLDAYTPNWMPDATHAFYAAYQDRYDVLALFREDASDTAEAMTVRNDVTGIGLPLFDDSGAFGSGGTLQLLTSLPFAPEVPFLHEVAHRWGNYLQPLFDPDDGFGHHWGYSGVDGVLGGFDQNSLVANGDGTFTVSRVAPLGYRSDYAFSSLERYLAGYAPSTAVTTMTVFRNPHPQALTFAADERTDVTIAHVQSQFGARSPDFDQAPKELRLAIVGVSTRPLSQAEMTFLDRVARNYDGSSSEINGPSGCAPYPQTFSWATGGATLDTTIRTTAPRNVLATATTPASVSVSWEPVDGANQYRVYRTGSINQPFQLVGTSSSPAFNDSGVVADRGYLYAVTSVGANGESPRSTSDFATTVIFTNDPLNAASHTIRAIHVNEIRTAVDAMRVAAGLTKFSYSDSLLAGLTPIRAQHLRELRTALDAARAGLHASARSYSDETVAQGSTPIKAAHWQELRDGSK